jgi:curved DNA-binding protein CbpA
LFRGYDSAVTVSEARSILSVDAGAGPREVQLAYRRKALECHPDRGASPEQSEAFSRRFLEVRDAYELLRRQGFPMPEAERVVPRPEYFRGGGRSFAAKPGHEDEAFSRRSFATGEERTPGEMLFWLLFLPAAAATIAWFLRFLVRAIGN